MMQRCKKRKKLIKETINNNLSLFIQMKMTHIPMKIAKIWIKSSKAI